jgi:HSP20 family protein
MYESMLSYPNSLLEHLERMRREMDDAFGTSALPSSIRSVAPGTLPAINVGRTAGSVEIYAFAPGIDPAKLDVTIDRGVLRISGERPLFIPDGQDIHVYARERRSGAFTRAVSLPDDVDPAQVKATYRDGVVHVSLLLRASARPQRIVVQ